jgi:uncharacterized membrane protein YgdD (TMEM256/DUF423 family)
MWLMLAGVNGALGVGFGALGAHGRYAMTGFIATASQFQLFHALALLGLAFALPQTAGRARAALALAAILFLAGTVLFSGSLYVRALTGLEGASLVAPFGGTGLILGWVAVILAGAFSIPSKR